MQDSVQIHKWLVVNEPDSTYVRRARTIGELGAIVGILLALTVPLGWALGIPILRPQNPSLTATHVIGTAFSILVGLSVLLLYRGLSPRWVRPLWIIVLVAMGEVILEYFNPGEFPFATAIRFLDPFENKEQIAPNAAMCMWFICLGAFLTTRGTPKAFRYGQAMCLIAAIVATLAIMGHAYSVEPFYILGSPVTSEPPFDNGSYAGMTAAGAVNYLLISFSLLLLRPEQGAMRMLTTRSSAGLMSRRLYSAVVIVPFVLGLFALVSTQVWKWYEIPFAISLLTIASVIFFASLVAFTSLRLESTDLSRASAEENLRASRERLRELSGHIQVLQEEERIRIAREVHDELGQSLTALKMDVALLRSLLPDQPDVEHRISSITNLVNTTIRSIQRISSELRPSALDDLGLAAAIEWQAREFESRSGVECALHLPAGPLPISASRSTALFRIFQETLTNVARHSKASQVVVRLGLEQGRVVLTVMDDGVGFADAAVENVRSLGIMGMMERATLVGGHFEISSLPGGGTSIRAAVPIDDDTEFTSPRS